MNQTSEKHVLNSRLFVYINLGIEAFESPLATRGAYIGGVGTTTLQKENKNSIKNMAEDGEGSKLRYAAERCELLAKVKSTVDGLLASGSHVTWSTYGGLARISDNVEQVLIHGSRIIVVSGWVPGPVFIYCAINMLVGLVISIGFY